MTRKELLLVTARIREELENIGKLREELGNKGYWPDEGNRKKRLRASLEDDDVFTLRALSNARFLCGCGKYASGHRP